MKIVDRAVEKALDSSLVVKAFAVALKACAEQVQSLGNTLALLAQNQATHARILNQLWNAQQDVWRHLHRESPNMQMPDISADDKKSEKPS